MEPNSQTWNAGIRYGDFIVAFNSVSLESSDDLFKMLTEEKSFLTTENYTLRNLMPEDAQEIFALRSSDEINKYLDRPKAHTLDDARNFITKIINGIAKNESIFWVVTPKGESKFLGSICLWKISREEGKAEIGFELLPENHGKGIMQEVIPRIIQFGFEELKLQTIQAELSPRNLKSVRMATEQIRAPHHVTV